MGRITEALKKAMMYKTGEIKRDVGGQKEFAPVSLERKAEYPTILLDNISPIIATYYEVGGGLLDAFQQLRATIVKNALRSLFVTSSLPQDGKTLVALNLAFAMANTLKDERKRVLVIDLDLHKRPFYEILGVAKEEKGLADILLNGGDCRDFIFKEEKTGLFILMAGTAHVDLKASKIEQIIQLLKSEFDFIIVDSMPVLAFVEPRELAPLFDAVLYIVRMLRTPRGSVNYGVQCLKDMGQKNIYFILNGVKAFLPKKDKSYYRNHK